MLYKKNKEGITWVLHGPVRPESGPYLAILAVSVNNLKSRAREHFPRDQLLRSSKATHSRWWVCGNMSMGTRRHNL